MTWLHSKICLHRLEALVAVLHTPIEPGEGRRDLQHSPYRGCTLILAPGEDSVHQLYSAGMPFLLSMLATPDLSLSIEVRRRFS